MIKRLMGSYPSLSVHDPKTFTVELITVLMKYPPSVSEYGITEARRSSPQFIPSIGQIEEACEQYAGRVTPHITWSEEWDDRSQRQLAEREEFERKSEPLEQRQKVAERILREVSAAFAGGEAEPYNVFVPMVAPQYADMVARGGQPGVSLEDKTRSGVWVPLSWLQGQKQEKATAWQRFSADNLLAKYPPKS